MKSLFKQVVVFLLIASLAVMSVGCYGSFNLTKKVYNWNGSVGDKWVVELVFLGLNIVPVYGVAGFIDVVILNLIEFWSGKNPMDTTVVSDDGTTVAFNAEKKQVEVTYAGKTFILVHENGKATVKDAEGNVIAYAIAGENGSMSIVDASGKVLSSYSMDEVNTMLANR